MLVVTREDEKPAYVFPRFSGNPRWQWKITQSNWRALALARVIATTIARVHRSRVGGKRAIRRFPKTFIAPERYVRARDSGIQAGSLPSARIFRIARRLCVAIGESSRTGFLTWPGSLRAGETLHRFASTRTRGETAGGCTLLVLRPIVWSSRDRWRRPCSVKFLRHRRYRTPLSSLSCRVSVSTARVLLHSIAILANFISLLFAVKSVQRISQTWSPAAKW